MSTATPATEPKGRSTLGDPLLTFLEYVMGLFLLFALIISPILGALVGTTDSEGGATEAATLSAVSFVTLSLSYQVIQATFPWIVAKRRNSTLRDLFGFSIDLPRDIGFGVGLAIACVIGGQIATVSTARLVGLENTDDASNAGILNDYDSSPWLIGVVLLVVIGAPLAEELLFRGFILHTLKKYFGAIFAVVASSAVFALPHWQSGATWQETTVLLSALGVVGLILAVGVIATKRLAPSMIAHALFNFVAVAATLWL